jgi:hypothetical protein
MKNFKIIIGALYLSSTMLFAQQLPTAAGPNPIGVGATSGTYWARGGNNNLINNNNIFRPCWCYHQQVIVVDCKALKNQIHVAFHYNVSQSNICNLYQLGKV